MRIQKAIGMLEGQRYTLTEIALECGFPDYHSFSVCMLQYCGRKPQEYRERITGSKEEEGLKRHYAKYPDEYNETCFKELEGNGSEETGRDCQKEEIAVHANAILQILGKN